MLIRADKQAKDCRDAQGNTPLHLAAYYGQTHCLRQLVRANADVNARNNAQQVIQRNGSTEIDDEDLAISIHAGLIVFHLEHGLLLYRIKD